MQRASHNRDWYRLESKAAAEDRAALFLFDEIGRHGSTARDLVNELFALDVAQIDVHINSTGGKAIDGIVIFEALRTHQAHITTRVDSVAASIASVIVQAGDRRVMVSGSQMMIHRAWGFPNVGALALTDITAGIYAKRAGGEKKHFLSLMSGEKWFTAAEAVAEGLADEAVTPSPPELLKRELVATVKALYGDR